MLGICGNACMLAHCMCAFTTRACQTFAGMHACQHILCDHSIWYVRIHNTHVHKCTHIRHFSDHNKMRDPGHRLMVDTSDSKGSQQIDAICAICEGGLSRAFHSRCSASAKCDYMMCERCSEEWASQAGRRGTATRAMLKFACPQCCSMREAKRSCKPVTMFVEVRSPSGKVIVSSRAVAASPQASFEVLLNGAMSAAERPCGGDGEDLSRSVVRVSKAGSSETHGVDLDTPVSVASDAKLNFVRVLLTPEKAAAAPNSKGQGAPACAFKELMKGAGHCQGQLHAPAAQENSRELGNIGMFNMIVDDMRSKGLGVKTKTEAESSLLLFAVKLRNALWYAEHRHADLAVPEYFAKFKGHMKLAKKKKKTRADGCG